MTIKIAFTEDGTPWTADYTKLLESHIVVDIPENTAWWRMRYNTSTKKVEVQYPTLTDALAEEQLQADRAAEATAAKLLHDASVIEGVVL